MMLARSLAGATALLLAALSAHAALPPRITRSADVGALRVSCAYDGNTGTTRCSVSTPVVGATEESYDPARVAATNTFLSIERAAERGAPATPTLVLRSAYRGENSGDRLFYYRFFVDGKPLFEEELKTAGDPFPFGKPNEPPPSAEFCNPARPSVCEISDPAWVEAFLAAMKGGRTLAVRSVGPAGHGHDDVFPLDGLTKALGKLDEFVRQEQAGRT